MERISERIGEQIEADHSQERERVMGETVVPLLPIIPKLYIAIDGTGVPVVSHETKRRKGKDETGIAKTREAKVGCVFTQTKA